ncbi:unnamed protein product [Linum trigynum]
MKSEALKSQGCEVAADDGLLLTMSTLTEESVMAVKNAACERLLDQCVEKEMKSKKMNDCLNRFHVAMPKPRDQKERSVCIPQAVLEAKDLEAAQMEGRKTEKDIENENGSVSVYSTSLRKHHILANEECKEDILPEFLDGHNVYDFVDPDILLRLEELEREEGVWQAEVEDGDEDFEMDGEDLTPEEREVLQAIKKKKAITMARNASKKRNKDARRGEVDRVIPTLRPKHLFSGKRSIGKTDRR